MELHAVHVIHPMGERHHGTLSIAGRHFETIGNPIPVHYPRMIPSDRYPVGPDRGNTGRARSSTDEQMPCQTCGVFRSDAPKTCAMA